MTAYIQRHSELRDPPFNGKPEQVEAVQWTGHSLAELKTALPEVNARIDERSGGLIVTSDSSSDGWVEHGYYVGRTAKGWTFVMFPAHFEDRYEQRAAEETTHDVAERIDAKLTTAAEVEYARIGDTVIKDTQHAGHPLGADRPRTDEHLHLYNEGADVIRRSMLDAAELADQRAQDSI